MKRFVSGFFLVVLSLSFSFYPSGQALSSETVLFGLNVPLSGSYSLQGEDQLKAYKLAIDIINQQGGVIGKKIVYSVRDTETNAAVARKNAKEAIAEGAIMVTGGSASDEAIAQAEECQAVNKVNDKQALEFRHGVFLSLFYPNRAPLAKPQECHKIGRQMS